MAEIPVVLPETMVRTITSSFGEQATAFCERLPSLLADAARRWSLTILPPFPNLSYNYVTPVVRADGSEAVLKVGVPHKEIFTEMGALRFFDGRGSVRLLDADPENSLFLLERLRPGTTLTGLASEANDERATAIVVEVMRGLWRSYPASDASASQQSSFPTIREWSRALLELRGRFGGGVGPLPVALVEEAESLFNDLLASQAAPVLLHGDLHHDNILAANTEETRWLAIDPKGIVGEPAYETGAILHNLWPDHHVIANPNALIARRVYQMAEMLFLDRARVRGWGIVWCILSASWYLEDNNDEGWQKDIADAERIAAVRV